MRKDGFDDHNSPDEILNDNDTSPNFITSDGMASTADSSRPVLTDKKGFMSRLLKPIHKMSSHVKPNRKVAESPGTLQGLKAIACASRLNVLLVFLPLSWAFNWAKPGDDVLIFVFSLLAIIPLSKLLYLATNELSIRVGPTVAGLLNATMGNAFVFIVAIVAVTKCQLQIVQSSLIGSILSNLLLVMCLFAGGIRYQEQGFHVTPHFQPTFNPLGSTQINSSLLTLSVIAILLPGAFLQSVASVQPDFSGGDEPLTDEQEGSDIKKLSHGVAIILLFIYGSYLVFQLWSHAALYDDKDNFKSTRYDPALHNQFRYMRRTILRKRKQTRDVENDASGNPVNATGDAAGGTTLDETAVAANTHEEEEPVVPMMSFPLCIGLLAVVTVLVSFTAEWLVNSIDGVTDGTVLSKEWVGLILLPIVGNTAMHITAVSVSVKDKLTLSIGIAVGSSIQTALFVSPLMVIIAWIMGRPLLLLFDPFESVILFLSVLTLNYVVQDGKSNWLEGMILMSIYVIIAVCFFFYPGSNSAIILAQCTI